MKVVVLFVEVFKVESLELKSLAKEFGSLGLWALVVFLRGFG